MDDPEDQTEEPEGSETSAEKSLEDSLTASSRVINLDPDVVQRAMAAFSKPMVFDPDAVQRTMAAISKPILPDPDVMQRTMAAISKPITLNQEQLARAVELAAAGTVLPSDAIDDPAVVEPFEGNEATLLVAPATHLQSSATRPT